MHIRTQTDWIRAPHNRTLKCTVAARTNKAIEQQTYCCHRVQLIAVERWLLRGHSRDSLCVCVCFRKNKQALPRICLNPHVTKSCATPFVFPIWAFFGGKLARTQGPRFPRDKFSPWEVSYLMLITHLSSQLQCCRNVCHALFFFSQKAIHKPPHAG